ncbi:MAG: TetR/AcrR family transcriptional regulator [Nakamurella sp.]
MEDVASSGKQADQDELAGRILAAVVAVIAEDGFEGATIRRVAARARCSAGAVQKRFATRTQLLRATFEHVVATVVERMRAAADGPGAGDDTLVAQQRIAALQTLPLDDERRSESLVWISYLLRAAVDESLCDIPLNLDRAVRDALVHDLAAARAHGGLRSEANPAELADALLALVDGIAIRMLYTPPAEHAALVAALDLALEALLPT